MFEEGQKQVKPVSRIHSSHVGRYYSLVSEKNRHIAHLLTIGPQCILMDKQTLVLFFIICFCMVNLVSVYLLLKLNSSQEGTLYFYVYLVIAIYLDITWLLCALINPGIAIPEGDNEHGQTCEECYIRYNMIVPKIEGRYHCRRCAICIDNFKYHCYLSGNCVGKNNFIVSYFLLLGIMLWVIDLTATLPFVYYL